jgi:GNAT superfamily N-acetyltransferase
MSNQLNDPAPILLTDRLSAADRGALPRVADAGRVPGPAPGAGHGGGGARSTAPFGPERVLDSVFGPVTLCPLAADDAAAHADFLQALGERGRRMRGFSLPSALAGDAVMARPAAPARIAGTGTKAGAKEDATEDATAGGAQHLRLGLAPASARHAVQSGTGGGPRLLGELCVSIDRSRVAAEFALAVRPALHGHGLGRLLIHCLLDLCLMRRVTLACASVPAGSPAMLALAHACGFQILRAADGSAQLALMLRPRGVR